MSPEQARGKPVDKRADIWAFGGVLFEMLTGTARLPTATTVSDTLAAVLKSEPAWAALPPRRRRRCAGCCARASRRIPRHGCRRSATGSFCSKSGPARGPGEAPVGDDRGDAGAAIAGLAVGMSAIYVRDPAAPAVRSSVVRLTATLPAGVEVDHRVTPALALSPDGTTLVYVGGRGGASAQLFLRSLDGSVATAISGTDGAQNPFFSPNGDWIGFFAQGKLKKVSTTGGALQILCDAPAGQGGSWAADDTIYFVPFNTSGVWKVPAAGGTPRKSRRWTAAKAR